MEKHVRMIYLEFSGGLVTRQWFNKDINIFSCSRDQLCKHQCMLWNTRFLWGSIFVSKVTLKLPWANLAYNQIILLKLILIVSKAQSRWFEDRIPPHAYFLIFWPDYFITKNAPLHLLRCASHSHFTKLTPVAQETRIKSQKIRYVWPGGFSTHPDRGPK